MQILVVQILVNLKRLFGHSSAPQARIELKITGKASQQCRPPFYNPQIIRKQRFTLKCKYSLDFVGFVWIYVKLVVGGFWG